MVERARSKVTLVLTESDVKKLRSLLGMGVVMAGAAMEQAHARIEHEIKHALAECDCAGEVGR